MARYSRRRWRRRRRAFRRRIPKAIGSSSRNMVKMRVNIESNYIIHFTQGNTYADQIILECPYATHMIPTPYTVGMPDMEYISGLYKSESFRKMLTMYQEMKVDGMYAQINVAPSSSYNSIRLYCTWDRMGSRTDGAKYRNYWPNDPYGKIKANSNEQGGRARIFCPSKGSVMPLFTKCIARNANEKTNFVSTQTTVNEVTFPSGSYGQGWKYYQWVNGNWWNNTFTGNFSPMLYAIFENDQPTQSGGFSVQVQVRMTYYVTFRNPGVSAMDDSVYELLLKCNADLQPFNPNNKSDKKPDTEAFLIDQLKENPIQPVPVTVYEREEESKEMDET